MRIAYTALLTIVWISVMQANIGWVGTESTRLQVGKGLSADEAFRRVIWRTVLFASLYTGAAIYLGWRIWR
jgi:hypothetical protein